jgi:hypothetical protein
MRCVTANLGFGGPGTAADRSQLATWLDGLEERCVDLLFLQEMPGDDSWPGELAERGWALHVHTEGQPYRCRSGVAVHDRLGPAHPVPLPTGAYHGSYLAAVRVEAGDLGPVTCVSVHAGPSRPTPTEIAAWKGGKLTMRAGGEWWDSDFVLATLLSLVREGGTVLAAGDLNEARRWDTVHGGTWGADWFRTAETGGLHDLLHASKQWGRESLTSGEYQIDHVLGTADLRGRITNAEALPPPADHDPINFEVQA